MAAGTERTRMCGASRRDGFPRAAGRGTRLGSTTGTWVE